MMPNFSSSDIAKTKTRSIRLASAGQSQDWCRRFLNMRYLARPTSNVLHSDDAQQKEPLDHRKEARR